MPLIGSEIGLRVLGFLKQTTQILAAIAAWPFGLLGICNKTVIYSIVKYHLLYRHHILLTL